MDNFKVILEAIIDNSSLTNAQKQLAKERLKISADISIQDFIKSKNEIKEQIKNLGREIKNILGDAISDKEAKRWAKEYYSQMIEGAKEAEKAQQKLNKAQTQKNLATQEKYYQRIIDNNKTIYSLKEKLLTADKKQEAEIQRQITLLEKRNQYNASQLSKKGLTDNSWEWEVNSSKEVLENRLRINQEKQKDIDLSKQITEVDRIKLSMSGEGKTSYGLEVSTLIEKYKNLGLTQEQAEEKVKELTNAHTKLSDVIKQNVSDFGSLEAKNRAIIEADEKRTLALNKVNNEYKEMALTAPRILTDVQRLNKVESMQKWADNNSKAVKKYGNDINRIIERFAQLEVQMNSIESDKLVAEFKEIQNQARKTGNIGMTAADKLKNAWEKFGGWSLATGALTKVWYGMKSVYEASIELDGAVTDLTMATGANKEQIDSLIDSYSDLAEELNATITDVVISGTEWLKQGKSIAETETLIRNSMILSKIAKLDSADSTTYLTSVMKGYKVAAEDTLNVVDKLSAVDMASATNVGGLAEGMSEVASSADLAGVSMDKLLGYLATIGEVTQSGMSEVGTTLNAVFSRMGNIKLSRLTDYETGEDLSNVETVLRGVRISLRDTDNSFRDFDEVLDETASRWTSFSDVQQRAIASAFAGTHHMNEFIILMENYGKALEYTEVSMNSSGEAMQKFEVYQDSVAAHTDSFKKSVQDLADTAVDSGLVNFFIDLGTFGVKAIDGIVSALTPLGTLITGTGLVGIGKFVKDFD